MITTLPPHKLHLEYQFWLAELNFDIELIKTFEAHLAFISSHNKSKESTPHIEQFQNRFIRQREVIDELKHDLNNSELRERFLIFRELFDDLKTRFRYFETEHL